MLHRIFQGKLRDRTPVPEGRQPILPGYESDKQYSLRGAKTDDPIAKQYARNLGTLWQCAYQNVADENHELVQKYEEIVRKKATEIDGHNLLGKEEQMQAVIENCQRTIKSRRWVVRLSTKEICVRDQVQRIVKIVQQFSGVVGALTALDPVYASPVWTGISLILPVSNHSL
jgi:hypothetical protein